MKIMVADDDPVTRHLLQTSLERWQHEVILATDGIRAMEILFGPESPQIALLDWMMPGIDGVEICRELRKRNTGPYVYTLLLTARTTKDDVLKGLEAGADDYLIKPFDLLELQARLRTGKRIIDLQGQLIAAREAMRDQATHDPLTGSWNRRALVEIIKREIERARREKSSFALLMLDLDHFKQINDTMGHQAGDQVLQEVTRRVQAVIRPYDSVGRYGGEEFLVLVSGYDCQSALGLGERVRLSICTVPFAIHTHPIALTISIGIACIGADPDLENLIRRADEALYNAKSEGRNCCKLG